MNSMNIKHYPLEKLKKQIKEIAEKYLDLSEYKLFLFGSRALNKGDERSDIDIGIEGKEAVPYETMAKIREEAENLQLLYKIDIVDFSKVSDEFKEISKKSIEPIN